MLTTLRIVPLLILPLAFFAVFGTGVGWTKAEAFTWEMFSGARWSASHGDLFVLVSLLVLFLEMVKSVNTTAREIINHGLSLMVAVVCLLLFVIVPSFTNSAFLQLTVIAFIDVVAGFVITIVAARRDIGTSH